MRTRKDLIKSRSYWLTNIQIDVFNLLKTYMDENGLNQKQVAEQLKVSPSYVSQILNGNFNFTVAKLIELSLAVGKVPLLNFETYEEFLQKEQYPEHKYWHAVQENNDGGTLAHISISDLNRPHIQAGSYISWELAPAMKETSIV